MSQTKKKSLVESITNTAVGFLVSYMIQLIVFPLMNIPVTWKENIALTTIFTIASILRGYLIRRYFNSKVR